MSGYVHAMGFCFACGRVFSFNPHKVPSIRWPAPDGDRRPICRHCIEAANPKRIANGLPPVHIDPEAYEAIPEEEL